MAIYDTTAEEGRFTPKLSEWLVYGSESHGRFETVKPFSQQLLITWDGLKFDDSLFTRRLRYREYELKDHLGNVRVTFSDLKLQPQPSIPPTDSFRLDLLSVNNYYPFGMLEPERNWTKAGTSSYRYLFNGKEQDDEIKGIGKSFDYGFRFYDPRNIRFFSIDPLFLEYPWYTPYQFSGLNPIWAVDRDGLEETVVVKEPIKKAATETIKKTTTQAISKTMVNASGQLVKQSFTSNLIAFMGKAVSTVGSWTLGIISTTMTLGEGEDEYFKANELGIIVPKEINAPTAKKDPETGVKTTEDDEPEYVYRGGSDTKVNLTPRLGTDTKPSDDKKGLSTFTTAEEAMKESKNSKAQQLSTKSLRAQGLELKKVGTHVSILPPGPNQQKKLEEWAEKKETMKKDPTVNDINTTKVQNSVTGTVYK